MHDKNVKYDENSDSNILINFIIDYIDQWVHWQRLVLTNWDTLYTLPLPRPSFASTLQFFSVSGSRAGEAKHENQTSRKFLIPDDRAHAIRLSSFVTVAFVPPPHRNERKRAASLLRRCYRARRCPPDTFSFFPARNLSDNVALRIEYGRPPNNEVNTLLVLWIHVTRNRGVRDFSCVTRIV